MNKFIQNLSRKIRHGGMVGSLKKAFSLYRREGMAGIKRGLGIPAPDTLRYAEWVLQYDTLTDQSRQTIRERIKAFAYQPLISVIVPVFNPKPEWLAAAIESVREQLYPHWELCIADDASTDPRIRALLQHYVDLDVRIKVTFREHNGHISAASNSALELARGAWAALLDHDDVLNEQALFWVADALNNHADLMLIYSDEDTLDEQDRRSNPNFKCDWNEDLFYSQNMICHLAVYRVDRLKAIGGFRVGLEGSQDYDLALRYIETIAPQQIHHIPRVLYHWRIHAASTALSPTVKPYALLAGEKALNDHFRRMQINAQASHTGYSYRARYGLPDSPPKVSLIVLEERGLSAIRRCVGSILEKTSYRNIEIILITQESTANAKELEVLRSRPEIHILSDNVAATLTQRINAGVRAASGGIIGIVSNGTEVTSGDWLDEMVSHAVRPSVGAVGARLWLPNGKLYHGGIILGINGVAGYAHRGLPRYRDGHHARAILPQNFSAVSGKCLLVRKAIFDEVGGFNETDALSHYVDVDFCLRVQTAGYRNLWTPYAELTYHELPANRPDAQADLARASQYMQQRWGELLQRDPAYNPNLTLDKEDFSYAWPPRVEQI